MVRPGRTASVPHPEKDSKTASILEKLSKTRLCTYYNQGFCKNGSSCTFAHGTQEVMPKPDLRKTSICKDWEKGVCPQTSWSCPFAHGSHELRHSDSAIQDVAAIGNVGDPANMRRRSKPIHCQRRLDEDKRGGPLAPIVKMDAQLANANTMQSFGFQYVLFVAGTENINSSSGVGNVPQAGGYAVAPSCPLQNMSPPHEPLPMKLQDLVKKKPQFYEALLLQARPSVYEE
eukprot:TRINITY_DN1300_c0_g1_i1.p1 TRINITY_DN1300_c0_g1~~TRINITY_DN1300_c0_g1_i1.p1  ORF type:complete len:231 (-),score=44.22 TRINITY_DN1300_c0_g1_i1:140-832(-)